MLAMRPNCECCGKDLPAADTDAFICSFECSFCSNCTQTHLDHTCPNCGGELVKRPPRKVALQEKFPASTDRVLNEKLQQKHHA